MHRHYSLGTADLVALMAAHRAALDAPAAILDQTKISRIKTALNETREIGDTIAMTNIAKLNGDIYRQSTVTLTDQNDISMSP